MSLTTGRPVTAAFEMLPFCSAPCTVEMTIRQALGSHSVHTTPPNPRHPTPESEHLVACPLCCLQACRPGKYLRSSVSQRTGRRLELSERSWTARLMQVMHMDGSDFQPENFSTGSYSGEKGESWPQIDGTRISHQISKNHARRESRETKKTGSPGAPIVHLSPKI